MKSCIVLLTLVVAATSFAIQRWWSPDKLYSITPPADWSQGTSRGAQSSSYAFRSPDQKAEIRISAAYNLLLPETLPEYVLGLAFPKERGVTAIKRIRGEGWDGLRREYTDAGDSARWLGFAARHGSTVVLLTMRAPAKEFEHFRPIFESVGQSLMLANESHPNYAVPRTATHYATTFSHDYFHATSIRGRSTAVADLTSR